MFDSADVASHKHTLLNSAQITLRVPISTFDFTEDWD